MNNQLALSPSTTEAFDLQKLLAFVPSAAYSCDPEGLITHFNQAAAEIWGRKPALRNPCDRWSGAYRLYDAQGESINHEECWMAKALQQQTKFHEKEIVIERPDGTRRVALAHATPFFGPNQQLLGAVKVFVDITGRRRIDEELLRTRLAAESFSQGKGDFLANMSHKVRTPLTAILGYADLLGKDGDQRASPSQRQEYAETIRRNGEHLLALVNDILDISKMEVGKLTIEQVELSPEQIVFEVIAILQAKAQAKGLSLEAEFATPIPLHIHSDPARLRQVLIHLVGNAIKFTVVGKVVLRVSYDLSEKEFLTFAVVDTGIGLTSQQMGRLFQPFEQLDNSSTRQIGGTGLGLSISKRLAQMLGGDITVTSHLGSTFTLQVKTGSLAGVPVSEPRRVISQAPSGRSDIGTTLVKGQPLVGIRVLLAEDGPDNQRFIAFILRKAGAEVRVVENGRLAVEALTSDGTISGSMADPAPVDLLLTDMQMPEMDGYTATRLLRMNGCQLAIVALTAHAMEGDADKCRAAGCDDYVAKPVSKSKLIDACLQAMAASRTRLKTTGLVPAISQACEEPLAPDVRVPWEQMASATTLGSFD